MTKQTSRGAGSQDRRTSNRGAATLALGLAGALLAPTGGAVLDPGARLSGGGWGVSAQAAESRGAPEQARLPKPRPEPAAKGPEVARLPKPRPGSSRSAPSSSASAAASAVGAALAPTAYASSVPRTEADAAALGGAANAPEGLPAQPRSGRVGFLLMDTATGRVLATRREAELFLPASLAKTPTALYALAALGPQYRFPTTVYGAGPIVDGELQGDLTLVGSGDPTLDTGDLADLVKQLKEVGLTKIRGRLLYDAGALPTEPQIEPGQPVHAAYNPSISGLNLNFNRVLMRWQRLKDGEYDVNLFAHARRWSAPAENVAGGLLGPDEGRIFRHSRQGPGQESWRVSSKVLGRRGSRWLPIQIPGHYAAVAFQTVAKELSVELPDPEAGSPPPGSKALVTSSSEPMRDIVEDMLKYSTNLTAEAIGLAASKAQGGGRLSLSSSAALMSLWVTKEFDLSPGEMRFSNHSGLTSTSRASPKALSELLNAAAKRDPGLPQLLPRHRVGGLHKATVRAKTGTMYYGRGLSGFILCSSGRSLTFSFMHSDLAGRENLDEVMDPESTFVPRDARVWLGRARRIEKGLLARWTKRYCV